jgi:hypothetical protein
MKYGYARIFMQEKGATDQLDALKKARCKKIFKEAAVAKRVKRPALQRCLKALERGDTLIVWKLDRLASSTAELIVILDQLRNRGVKFRSLCEAIDTAPRRRGVKARRKPKSSNDEIEPVRRFVGKGVDKRIAVVTDATSAGFWFPAWYRYYAGEFGADALHVVTYEGKRREFKDFDLAGLWDVAHSYDDELRPKVISGLVRSLLLTHDVVVRCDVDEFLIPDLRKFEGLKDYVQKCELPYVCAYGIEVFERSGDTELDASVPILSTQRRHAITNSALHKIAVTSIPLDWWPGFHSANAQPVFDDLYLFHLKFADIDLRVAWFEFMKASVPEGSFEHTYFSCTMADLMAQKQSLSEQPCRVDGWSNLPDPIELQRFFATVTRDDNGCCQGEFFLAPASFVIPDEYRGKL